MILVSSQNVKNMPRSSAARCPIINTEKHGERDPTFRL